MVKYNSNVTTLMFDKTIIITTSFFYYLYLNLALIIMYNMYYNMCKLFLYGFSIFTLQFYNNNFNIVYIGQR